MDERINVPGANLVMGVAWHPSGRFALATLNRTKSAVPMTRLLQGWTITNGLAVIWRDGGVDEVLLDEPDMGFADASDVACTPDGLWVDNTVSHREINGLRGHAACPSTSRYASGRLSTQ